MAPIVNCFLHLQLFSTKYSVASTSSRLSFKSAAQHGGKTVVLRLLCLARARLAGSEDFGNTIVDRFFIFDCTVSQVEISF